MDKGLNLSYLRNDYTYIELLKWTVTIKENKKTNNLLFWIVIDRPTS